MTDWFPCLRKRGQPRTCLAACIGSWTEAQRGKKRSACRNCPAFYTHVAELFKMVVERK